MRSTGSVILTGIFVLASFLSGVYMLYRLGKEKGGVHALLGIVFPPYPFAWGWLNARRLEILDIMAFWTLVSLASVVFPLAMGLTLLNRFGSAATEAGPASFAEDVFSRGTIGPGSQVSGQLDDLFAVDEWVLTGAAGQRINLWCAPVTGSDTDPRLTLLDPQGNLLAADDDSGGGTTARISDLILPENGTYRIQIDVWSTGPYILSVE